MGKENPTQYVENKGFLVPKTGIPVIAEVFPKLIVIQGPTFSGPSDDRKSPEDVD